MSRKVFISSAMGPDMTSWRRAAVAGVESLDDYAPLWVESEAPTPDTPVDACLRLVAEADVVVLLLGDHYGSLKESGLSATEEEILEARRLGKPIFGFDFANAPDSGQAAFRARLREWGSGHLLTPCSTESELQKEVVRGLLTYDARHLDGSRAALANEALSTVLPSTQSGTQSRDDHRIALALTPTRAPMLDEAAFFQDLPPLLQDLTVAGDSRISDTRLATVERPDHIELVSDEGYGQRQPVLTLGTDGTLAVVASFRLPTSGIGDAMEFMMYARPSLAAETLHRMVAIARGVYAHVDRVGRSPQAFYAQVGLSNLGMANFCEPPTSTRGGTPVQMRQRDDAFLAYPTQKQIARGVLQLPDDFIAEAIKRLQRVEAERPRF